MKVEKSRLSADAINELREGGDTFFREMLDILINSLQEGMIKLRHTFEMKEWQKVGDRAHGMRGPCSHLGIDSLWQLLKEIEEKSNSETTQPEIELLLVKTESEAALVIQELRDMASKANQ